MTKSLMISIQPQHAVNILNGKKTLELRTWIPKGYVGWVYAYVSRGKDRLSVVHDDEICKTYYYLNSTWGRELNGEVVARFWFDEYETIKERFNGDEYTIEKLDELCLSDYEVKEYLGNKKGYAWHIKKLEVFYKPLWLKNFYSLKNGSLKKPPISWQYVYVKGESK